MEFCGPSATSGYFHNPEETRRLFRGTWLDAGDLAYMASGEVYITGRTKDLIIRAGRNIYPQELEEAIGDIPRIRKGCVAVFGWTRSHVPSAWSSWPRPMRQTPDPGGTAPPHRHGEHRPAGRTA